MLAHASGRHGLAVLDPAVELGALPLALHPVMTFTGRPDDVDRLAGICFGVTAPEVLRPVAEVLVMEMGGEPVFIAEDDRGLYHAALAGAANHLVTQVVQAADLLARRASASRPGCSARCCPPRSTTPCALGDAALDRAGRPRRRGDRGRPRRGAPDRRAARRCPPTSPWPG